MQWVQNLWNSIDFLSTAFRYLTVVSILFTAAFGVGLLTIKERISSLQAAVSAEKDRTAKEQSEKIQSQSDTVAKLNDELAGVRARASQLEAKAIDAARNITDVYDFQGVRRQTVAGRTSAIAGPETGVFNQMMAFYDQKAWPELLLSSERQIKATPDWLTPQLLAGIALANLARFDEAKVRLQQVMSRAGNDPQYKAASEVLEQLKLEGK